MRRNKVRPLDNGGTKPINAFDLDGNPDQTDGDSQRPLVGSDNDLIVNDKASRPENTSTPSGTFPHSRLTGTSAAEGSHSQPIVSLSKKGQPLKDTASSEVTLVSDSPPTSLKRLVAVDERNKAVRVVSLDRRSSELVTSVTETSVNTDQSAGHVVSPPWTISEGSSMGEQDRTGSAIEQDLLRYFTELNDNESSDIDMDEADHILLEGANVNARGTGGQTCMHLAARHWKKEVVQFLFEKGADLHEPDDFGVTPLHEAARVDNEEVVSYLTKNNPDISCVTSDTFQTVLHYAVLGSAINSIYVRMQTPHIHII